MWKNPILAAVAGVLAGFFIGFLVGQGQPAEHAATPPAAAAADPHAGVPGAPPLSGQSQAPPPGGRTAATADPRLMEQARELDRLLAANPSSYEHLVQMGNVQYDMQAHARAIEFYEQARAIRDDSADVLTDLGVCYRETKQPQKALTLFDRAADLKPAHWQSRYNAAVVRLFDLNDLAGAREELEKLKRLGAKAPDMPDLSGLEQEIAKRAK
jgi:cytochrome c-type biogenesis protein CcmH/NrfG